MQLPATTEPARPGPAPRCARQTRPSRREGERAASSIIHQSSSSGRPIARSKIAVVGHVVFVVAPHPIHQIVASRTCARPAVPRGRRSWRVPYRSPELTNTLISTNNPISRVDDAFPFDVTVRVRKTCICLHLQQAARAVARRFDAALRPLDLTNGQFSLLMFLNRPEAARIGDVSALLAMDRTTLTANLKPLERRGLVIVSVDDVA
jgi:MarR family